MFFSMCIEQSTCFKWLYPCGKQLHFKSFHQQAAFFLKGPTPLKINMEPGKWSPLSKPEIPAVFKKPVTFFQVPNSRLFRLVVPNTKGFWFRLVSNNKKPTRNCWKRWSSGPIAMCRSFDNCKPGGRVKKRGVFFFLGWIFVLFRKEVTCWG